MLAAGFEALPGEYQEVIRLAQERYSMSVTPLQALSGGWSGASIYLASVAFHDTGRVEHFVLKLDHKNERARSDEIHRHQEAARLSPEAFASHHMAQMVFERVEQDGAVAIFYTIAGQSLQQFRPLSAFESQHQLETLFNETGKKILHEWNAHRTFRQAVHPQQLLKDWLGFRVGPGAPAEDFLQSTLRVPAEMPGLLVQGMVLPNPLAYARDPGLWGAARPLDAVTGLQHGDLNTNNILVKFSRSGKALEGYYLIDFALFKDGMPLLYDLRYLELSYLLFKQAQVPFRKLVDFLLRYGENDRLEPQQIFVELTGTCAIINSARLAFQRWAGEHHPSLRDDLWGQYLLAGAAAGLTYCHKGALSAEERLTSLIFAGANLKRYAALFGVPAPVEGRQIDDPQRWLDGTPARALGRPAARSIPHNLPANFSTFVGRDASVRDLQALLTAPDVRLVTLTGPGGVGKTRLALHVAGQLLSDRKKAAPFVDGIYFVPLAEIVTPERALARIAQSLEVREHASQPLMASLQDYLRDKHILLLLDNLEQVVTAGPVLMELLQGVPGLKVLATSRVVLQLRGEHEYAVPPMQIPEADGSRPDLRRLEEYEAVRLFVERAQAVSPQFALTEDNAPAVIEICRRLDGLPLAIELAAARTKLFPVQALLGRLGNRLALLTGGPRDMPARQQTLRSTLDWSYSLLDADTQTLFARFGIFVGGFALEAAEAICSPDGTPDVLDGVYALVNNSLLRPETGAHGQPRFRMLETIREYALERLSERGELTAMQHRHAAYFIEKMDTQVRYKLMSSETTYWLDWLENEHDNVLAALGWGQDVPETAERIPRISPQLAWFWYRRGYFNEGRTWTDRWLAMAPKNGLNVQRAYALMSSSLMGTWRGDLSTALERGSESLELWQRLEDEEGLVMSHLALGAAHINMGNDTAAHPLYYNAHVMAEQMGAQYFDGVSLVHLGNVALGLGNVKEAQYWQERAYAISKEFGDGWLISFTLNNLGEVARVQGDYEKARAYYEQSERLLREMGDKGDLARLVSSLGWTALHRGDIDTAREQFSESLAMFRRLGNKRGIAENMAAVAALKRAEGQPVLAARVLGAAEGMMERIGAAWWPSDRVEVNRSRDAIRGQVDEATFQAEWAAGHALTTEQALCLAVDACGG